MASTQGGYPAESVGKILREGTRNVGRRAPRRTPRESAAEKLIAAIAALTAAGVEPGDAVALDDARAVAERYRQKD
jgi:hypothetical protein